MYAGFAYASAPYAGGSVATVAPVDGIPEGAAVRLRLGGGVLVESDAAGSVRAAGVFVYDVVRVFPTPDLVSGRPT